MDYYGSIHPHFFSKQNDKRHISTIIEDSANGINEFFDKKFLEFFESDEFKQSVKSLENTINDKLHRFFGTTNKSIRFIDEYDRSLKTELFLLDDQNYIQSHDMSTGEAVLLNLVVGLATSNEIEHDILSFDEPELHMHDDMIKVFVQEILELNQKFPNQKILVASHSTGLIENIILHKDKNINLIIFDKEKNVFNSDKDIQLINALNRNGVWFSPLMLTKKPNLFIENQGSEGFQHRDFLMSFFEADDLPNIIPIGTSGNVEQIDAFTSVFEDILKTTDVKSWGIRDGDILIKQYLVQYLKGELTLEKIIKIISSHKDIYIYDKTKGGNQFYFNCWEIENLYLMDELLSCWKKGSGVLTTDKYRSILMENRDVIFREYFNTFYKSIIRIRSNKNQTPREILNKTKNQFQQIEETLANTDKIESHIYSFIDELLQNELLQWVPGKEIKKLLEELGYVFKSTEVNYRSLRLSKKIQSILNDESSIHG